MAIVGAILGERPVYTALVAQFYGLVGPAGAKAIEGMLQDLHQPGVRTIAGIVGSLLLLVGASAVFVELEDALSLAYDHHPAVRDDIQIFTQDIRTVARRSASRHRYCRDV